MGDGRDVFCLIRVRGRDCAGVAGRGVNVVELDCLGEEGLEQEKAFVGRIGDH